VQRLDPDIKPPPMRIGVKADAVIWVTAMTLAGSALF
jgi:hypothetical protein